MAAVRLTLAILALALLSGLWALTSPSAGAAARLADPEPAFESADTTPAWVAPAGAIAQGRDAQTSADDTRVPVQVWTVLAAGGAAGVGLVVYLLRVAMGWVKPPPPQKEPDH